MRIRILPNNVDYYYQCVCTVHVIQSCIMITVYKWHTWDEILLKSMLQNINKRKYM